MIFSLVLGISYVICSEPSKCPQDGTTNLIMKVIEKVDQYWKDAQQRKIVRAPEEMRSFNNNVDACKKSIAIFLNEYFGGTELLDYVLETLFHKYKLSYFDGDIVGILRCNLQFSNNCSYFGFDLSKIKNQKIRQFISLCISYLTSDFVIKRMNEHMNLSTNPFLKMLLILLSTKCTDQETPELYTRKIECIFTHFFIYLVEMNMFTVTLQTNDKINRNFLKSREEYGEDLFKKLFTTLVYSPLIEFDSISWLAHYIYSVFEQKQFYRPVDKKHQVILYEYAKPMVQDPYFVTIVGKLDLCSIYPTIEIEGSYYKIKSGIGFTFPPTSYPETSQVDRTYEPIFFDLSAKGTQLGFVRYENGIKQEPNKQSPEGFVISHIIYERESESSRNIFRFPI